MPNGEERSKRDAVVEATKCMPVCKDTKLLPESINHPAHYGGADNPYEVIKVIEAWALGFNLGNAVKYLGRAGRKSADTYIQDLEKARWYLTREIDALNGLLDEEVLK